MVLADEINRTPPKTQAALLEAMQEHAVTAGEHTYELPEPFFVLATQNPIEQEGTYPLPEAQLDRFMFMTIVDYPTRGGGDADHEAGDDGVSRRDLKRLLDGPAIQRLQEIVRRVPVAEHVYAYARDMVRATRPNEPGVPEFVKELVQWGAGPRASIYLILAGKARAILNGRRACDDGGHCEGGASDAAASDSADVLGGGGGDESATRLLTGCWRRCRRRRGDDGTRRDNFPAPQGMGLLIEEPWRPFRGWSWWPRR